MLSDQIVSLVEWMDGESAYRLAMDQFRKAIPAAVAEILSTGDDNSMIAAIDQLIVDTSATTLQWLFEKQFDDGTTGSVTYDFNAPEQSDEDISLSVMSADDELTRVNLTTHIAAAIDEYAQFAIEDIGDIDSKNEQRVMEIRRKLAALVDHADAAIAQIERAKKTTGY